MMAKARIKDVAEHAGVSTATVSHVINQTRFVSEKTRKKVLEAIEALQYQPSAIARGLATHTTKTVGLIVSDITNPFFTAIVRGIGDEITKHGYSIILCNTDEDPDREEEYLRLLSAQQVEGLMIASAQAHSERLVRMSEENVPIVLIDRDVSGVKAPLVCVENEAGAYQATKYLIELGHRRIGILVGMETISTHTLRLNGYKHALTEAGIPIDETLIARTDDWLYLPHRDQTTSNSSDFSSNVQMSPATLNALQHLLDLSDLPTAIFVTSIQMILGTLHTLEKRQLHCPDDISIISFDDPEWASLFAPSLTAIRQPTYRMGQAAASLLMELIKDEEEIEYPSPFPVELKIRESCRRLV